MGQTFDWHKEVEKQWNDRAGFWNSNSQNMWDQGSRKTIIPFLKEHISQGSHMADLGCGDGYGSWKLYKEGYHVTGLDISEDMVERSRSRLENDQLRFVQGDLTRLPFANESFDGVLAINSLEWTEVPYRGLEEMRRILKSGGRLCIGILGPTAMPRQNSYRRVYGEEVICNTMMPWELEQMATETGWKLIDGHGIFKREVDHIVTEGLPAELQQALTFMWVFIFEKE